jgi:hypothetical protein
MEPSKEAVEAARRISPNVIGLAERLEAENTALRSELQAAHEDSEQRFTDMLIHYQRLLGESQSVVVSLEAEREGLQNGYQYLESQLQAARALLNLPEQACLSCGGDGGHDEGCRGTTGLMALASELQVARAELESEKNNHYRTSQLHKMDLIEFDEQC